MRYFSLIIVFFSFILIQSCAKQHVNKLQGSYQLITYVTETDTTKFVGYGVVSLPSLSDYYLGIEIDNRDVSIHTPVNGCGGKLSKVTNTQFEIGEMGCTMMWGVDSMANVWEARFVKALGEADHYVFTEESSRLYLESEEGETSFILMEFIKIE